MASLVNKVFAVTGGASGMGLATCRMLASHKAKAIAIGDFNDRSFNDVRKELQTLNPDVTITTTKIDVSKSSQVDEWISTVVKEHGGLDGAVNAAGVPQQTGARSTPTILEETNEMWDRVLGVNLAGVFYCNRAQIKAMTGLQKTPRSIVNIASMASLMHGPDCYSYGVSKAGVAYLTNCIAKDVAKLGIRVNTVSPSATKTPMLMQFFANAPAGGAEMTAMVTGGFNVVEADDIARAVVWLLSEDSAQVVGINMAVGDSPP